MYKAKGGCAGYDGDECPMKIEMKRLLEQFEDDPKATIEGLTALQILMLVHDWDHDDPSDKTANVSEIKNDKKRALEIKKCHLLCIFCHRHKSWVNEDYTSLCLLPRTCLQVETENDDEVLEENYLFKY